MSATTSFTASSGPSVSGQSTCLQADVCGCCESADADWKFTSLCVRHNYVSYNFCENCKRNGEPAGDLCPRCRVGDKGTWRPRNSYSPPTVISEGSSVPSSFAALQRRREAFLNAFLQDEHLLAKISYQMAMLLRHKRQPSVAIDDDGFAPVDHVVRALQTHRHFKDGHGLRDHMRELVLHVAEMSGSGGRFELFRPASLLRATHGHSFPCAALRCEVRMDFGAEPYGTGYMSLRKRDVVYLLDAGSDGWAQARTLGSGTQGWCPLDYLSVEEGQGKLISRLQRQLHRLSHGKSRLASARVSSMPARVLFDFSATDYGAEYLSLRKGDFVYLLDEGSDGWARGVLKLGEDPGWFPLDYVDNSTIARKTHLIRQLIPELSKLW